MKIKGLFAVGISAISSLSVVSADLIAPSPAETIKYLVRENVLISAGIGIAVIALISWLIIRKIKKKNAIKSNN